MRKINYQSQFCLRMATNSQRVSPSMTALTDGKIGSLIALLSGRCQVFFSLQRLALAVTTTDMVGAGKCPLLKQRRRVHLECNTRFNDKLDVAVQRPIDIFPGKYMEASENDWLQLVDSALALRKDEGIDGVVALWKDLAHQLISIIGEGGFLALYARSIYLTHTAFGWFAPARGSNGSDVLLNLKAALETGSAAEAGAANHMLLLKFITSLASLIGTSLTLRIASSAWRIDAAALNTSHKEFPHD
jgi:hypothetical protein